MSSQYNMHSLSSKDEGGQIPQHAAEIVVNGMKWCNIEFHKFLIYDVTTCMKFIFTFDINL